MKELSPVADQGWLKVDAKPVRNAILTWVSKWSNIFQQHLLSKVSTSMVELGAFMKEMGAVLVDDDEAARFAAEKNDGNELSVSSEQLLHIMDCARKVRTRMESTKLMFEPLRLTVELLKRYGVTVSEDTLKRLEDAPVQWGKTTRAMFATKERYSDAINAEGEQLKKEDFRLQKKMKLFLVRMCNDTPSLSSRVLTRPAVQDYFNAVVPTAYADPAETQHVLLDLIHHGAWHPELGSISILQQHAQRQNELQVCEAAWRLRCCTSPCVVLRVVFVPV